jgi:hypothetical protein
MKKLKLIKGDATRPIGDGQKILIHIVNSIGSWGSGYVISLSNRWKEPEALYRQKTFENNIKLGTISIAKVEDNTWVVNMVAQEGIGLDEHGTPPIRYNALQKCLNSVLDRIEIMDNPSIHVPFKMGADRAGGDWNKIVEMLEKTFCKNGIDVIAYNLHG